MPSSYAAGALFGASALLCSVASAQETVEMERTSYARREPPSDRSSQNAALELRFGPYSPKIDENTSSPSYDDFFGDGRRYQFGIELDWQFWRAPYLGTLGVGLGWGYTQMSAPNRAANIVPDGPISQESSLNIMPLYLVGVFRIDVLARNFKVPLVPYGKFGLAHAFWWVNDGIGTADNDAGLKGKDTSTGTQAAVGAMFLLDVLESSAARTLDTEGGVNNSYLFFEWSMSDFSGDQMNVGSNNWVTGFAFEM
jgi:hypothetical protein